jgi:hypothetical protein
MLRVVSGVPPTERTRCDAMERRQQQIQGEERGQKQSAPSSARGSFGKENAHRPNVREGAPCR